MSDQITGTYGSQYTSCTIFVYDGWYAIEGSCNVNRCNPELLVEGVYVEQLPDYDHFTADNSINSIEDLIQAIES
jgi:hypothetical protein